MVILVTPFMLTMAIVQAAIDNNRLVMNIIGAIVSYFLYTTFSQALFTALQCYTLKTLLFSVLHCKASWEYIEYSGCTSVATLCTVFWTIFFCLVCQ